MLSLQDELKKLISPTFEPVAPEKWARWRARVDEFFGEVKRWHAEHRGHAGYLKQEARCETCNPPSRHVR